MLLQKIMKDNIIQFGDTYWRQLCGSAMGTSVAVNYVNGYVGIHEKDAILQKYIEFILYYGRFIDDTFGVWQDDPNQPNAWNNFLQDFNNYGDLRWTTDGLTNRIIFLNFIVTITKNNRLHFES